MAGSYRHSGRHEDVISASAGITSGALVNQEGIFGVAIKSAVTGASLTVDCHGVHDIPVPASTVKGDKLWVSLAAESVSLTLTRTGASGLSLVGIARTDRDTTTGRALVKLADQPFFSLP